MSFEEKAAPYLSIIAKLGACAAYLMQAQEEMIEIMSNNLNCDKILISSIVNNINQSQGLSEFKQS